MIMLLLYLYILVSTYDEMRFFPLSAVSRYISLTLLRPKARKKNNNVYIALQHEHVFRRSFNVAVYFFCSCFSPKTRLFFFLLQPRAKRTNQFIHSIQMHERPEMGHTHTQFMCMLLYDQYFIIVCVNLVPFGALQVLIFSTEYKHTYIRIIYYIYQSS